MTKRFYKWTMHMSRKNQLHSSLPRTVS